MGKPKLKWNLVKIVSLGFIFILLVSSIILMALLLLTLGLVDQLKIKLKAGLVILGTVVLTVFIALKFSSGIIGNEVSHPILTKNPDLTRDSVEKRVYYALDLLLFSGGIGLALWISLVVLLFWKLKQKKINGRRKNILMVSLITYLIWVQFQNLSVVHLIYFWLLVGIIDQQ